jgi:hypothetical protein
MFNLDQAISEWRQQMAAGGIKAPDVLIELESHLRDEVDEQVRSRMSVQQALEAATHHIGQATVLRAEFEKADQAKRLRVRKNLLRVFGVTMGVFITSASLRRHIIVVNLVLGAVLTTPEVVTQIAMFVPLQLLCEVRH